MSESPSETPRSDLAADALEHYNKISARACESNSLIPEAIKAWERLPEIESEVVRLKAMFAAVMETVLGEHWELAESVDEVELRQIVGEHIAEYEKVARHYEEAALLNGRDRDRWHHIAEENSWPYEWEIAAQLKEELDRLKKELNDKRV